MRNLKLLSWFVVSSPHFSNLQEGSSKPRLFVVDVGSKFGTTVNGVKLQANVRRELSEGDLVILGASTCTLRVDFRPIVVCASGLSQQNLMAVKELIRKIGTRQILVFIFKARRLLAKLLPNVLT